MSIERARAQFRTAFGREPELSAVAPGRVNLIGEHTDYSDGFVFPAAIDKELFVAASLTDGPTELVSTEAGQGESFDAAAVELGGVGGWAKYPAGVAWAFAQKGVRVPNIRAAVSSNVPLGAGVSSSAAIEMAFAVIWRHLAGLDWSAAELAALGKVAENQFVGVSSGIMDQMASACGRAGHAMFLDTRSLGIRYAPLPDGVSVVLCDTRTSRELAGGAYNHRFNSCVAASQALGVAKLRDADLGRLEAATGLDPTDFRRARHVITENHRCLLFADALSRGDRAAVGRLMRKSHESLRDDYDVVTPALDAMAMAAWDAPGCIGARMTGAGFGGACVALVESDAVEAFQAFVLPRYRSATGIDGDLLTCGVVDGARLLA